jgi:DNA-binding MarR family transcriptional regulator
MPTHQSPRTFYLVMRLHQLVSECLEEALVPVGLTASQYTVLSLVRRHAPITSAELARRLRISAQSTGESVKALETKLLIERYGIEENKRVLVLKLTAQGRRLLTRAGKLVAEAEDRFFGALEPAERESLEAAVVRLRETAVGK